MKTLMLYLACSCAWLAGCAASTPKDDLRKALDGFQMESSLEASTALHKRYCIVADEHSLLYDKEEARKTLEDWREEYGTYLSLKEGRPGMTARGREPFCRAGLRRGWLQIINR